MKRKLAVLVLVASVALLVATPALAAGRRGGQALQYRQGNAQGARQSFSLVGVITGLEGSTIKIEVYHGDRIGQQYIGQEVAVQVTDSTRYRQWAEDGCTPITFEDVVTGATASIQGTVSGDTFTALRVTVDVPCCTQ
jgi:hypothetical protein